MAPSIEHARVPFVEAATVLDVGANRGQFALFAVERFPGAMVHAFEPIPAAAAMLRRLTPEARVRLYELALADAPGRATFHVARADDSSSLLAAEAEAARGDAGDRVDAHDRGTGDDAGRGAGPRCW